jgi:hypothetical protein
VTYDAGLDRDSAHEKEIELSNVLHASGVEHFQIAKEIVENYARYRDLGKHAWGLYLRLSYLMQERSTSVVRETTKESLIALDIDSKQLRAARTELFKVDLIVCEEVEQATGIWEYRLLNPANGSPMYNPKESKLKTLVREWTRDQLEGIFETYGLTLTPSNADDDKQVITRCPFHKSRDHKERSLSIRLADGAPWLCHVCNKKGNLYEFEKQYQLLNGKPITSKVAGRNVLARLRKAQDVAAKRHFNVIELHAAVPDDPEFQP